MQKLILSACITMLSSGVFAQGLSGETEFGSTGEGQQHASQFLFFEGEGWSGHFRLFQVEGVVKRAVAGIGPTLELGRSRVKLHLGFTTDHEIMVAPTLIAKVWGKDFVHIIDAKISTNDIPSGVYQKTFLSLNENGSWRLRVDHLWVGNRQVYIKPGVEYRRRGFFIAPYYDPTKGSSGLGYNFGFRF